MKPTVAYPFMLLRVSSRRDHHLTLMHGPNWEREDPDGTTRVVHTSEYYRGPKEWIEDVYDYIKDQLRYLQIHDIDMEQPIYPYDLAGEVELGLEQVVKQINESYKQLKNV